MVVEWRTGKQAPEGNLKERLNVKYPLSFFFSSFWSNIRTWTSMNLNQLQNGNNHEEHFECHYRFDIHVYITKKK